MSESMGDEQMNEISAELEKAAQELDDQLDKAANHDPTMPIADFSSGMIVMDGGGGRRTDMEFDIPNTHEMTKEAWDLFEDMYGISYDKFTLMDNVERKAFVRDLKIKYVTDEVEPTEPKK